MKDYELTRRAIRDIAAARDWYESAQPDLGNHFLDAVLIAIREARANPSRYPEVEPGVRGITCATFPYRVYYVMFPDRIRVRAVYHKARDPGAWASEDRE